MERNFNEIDWENVDPNKVSSSFKNGEGWQAVIWTETVGSVNSSIECFVKLPETIKKVIDDAINNTIIGH
jgi:hypothetical protein